MWPFEGIALLGGRNGLSLLVLRGTSLLSRRRAIQQVAYLRQLLLLLLILRCRLLLLLLLAVAIRVRVDLLVRLLRVATRHERRYRGMIIVVRGKSTRRHLR